MPRQRRVCVWRMALNVLLQSGTAVPSCYSDGCIFPHLQLAGAQTSTLHRDCSLFHHTQTNGRPDIQEQKQNAVSRCTYGPPWIFAQYYWGPLRGDAVSFACDIAQSAIPLHLIYRYYHKALFSSLKALDVLDMAKIARSSCESVHIAQSLNVTCMH
jgi:hypothetical protein